MKLKLKDEQNKRFGHNKKQKDAKIDKNDLINDS